MSNASRNIRGILAVAALTASVSWTVTAPASAGVTPCQGRDVVNVVTPGYTAGVCDEIGDVRVIAPGGETMTPAGDGTMTFVGDGAPRPVDRFARAAGLPGLSWASGTVSFTDAGDASFQSSPFGQPYTTGSPWVGTMSTAPDLPGLPGAPGGPGTGLDGSRFRVSRIQDLPGPNGAPTGDVPLPGPIPVEVGTENPPGTGLPGTGLPGASLSGTSLSGTDLPGTDANPPGTNLSGADLSGADANLPGTDLPGADTNPPGTIQLEVPAAPEAPPGGAAPQEGAEIAPQEGPARAPEHPVLDAVSTDLGLR
ncbi:pentapeptide repeat-containing protein [Streptosporangium subroseum]|uniref:pentapeptide repeat-containing protein n=1 Tax=Streptosporangium subroseum TaxID=106412 RepID=UPI00342D2903